MIVRTLGPRTILPDAEKPYPRRLDRLAESFEKKLDMTWVQRVICWKKLIGVGQCNETIIFMLCRLEDYSVCPFFCFFSAAVEAPATAKGEADANNVWINTGQKRYPIRRGLVRRPARPLRREKERRPRERRLRRKRMLPPVLPVYPATEAGFHSPIFLS